MKRIRLMAAKLLQKENASRFSHTQTSVPRGTLNNEGDIATVKVCSVGYFGTLWMTLNEKLQGQMSACL